VTEQDRPQLPADLQQLLGVETRPDSRTARMQAKAAEKRTDRHDAVQTWAEKRAARRGDRKAARADRRQKRTEKLTDRSERYQRLHGIAADLGQRLLVGVPILAPMAVAWTGQSEFATRILGWPLAAGIGFAAAWELSTAFCAWMYHRARTAGASGLKYRFATWCFAAVAALMNYWHAAGPGWAPNARAVSFATMSVAGIVLWELYASLVHSEQLRAEGMAPPVRPRFGPVRWIRYPVRSWTAWSLAILEGHRTVEAAWTAADALLRSRAVERARRTDRTADRRSDRPAAAAKTTRTAAARMPDADRAVRTGPKVDLAKAGPTTDGPDRETRTAVAGPKSADQAGGPLVLSDMEQEAVDLLRSAGRSISKRSIADVVRKELGRSIGSDRAAEIARHFRTLKAA
jgi:hypothetical protein